MKTLKVNTPIDLVGAEMKLDGERIVLVNEDNNLYYYADYPVNFIYDGESGVLMVEEVK